MEHRWVFNVNSTKQLFRKVPMRSMTFAKQDLLTAAVTGSGFKYRAAWAVAILLAVLAVAVPLHRNASADGPLNSSSMRPRKVPPLTMKQVLPVSPLPIFLQPLIPPIGLWASTTNQYPIRMEPASTPGQGLIGQATMTMATAKLMRKTMAVTISKLF